MEDKNIKKDLFSNDDGEWTPEVVFKIYCNDDLNTLPISMLENMKKYIDEVIKKKCNIVEQTTEEYIQQIIDDGYIAEDGTPLKCACGCTDFEESDQYYEDYNRVEYALNCKACGNRVGYWAYGNWDILG